MTEAAAPRGSSPLQRGVLRRRLGRRRALAGAAVLLLLAAVLGRTFVVPPSDAPRPTDLVAVLGGVDSPSRTERAREVLAEHPGAVLLVVVGQLRYCPDRPPGASELLCVLPPDPSTTQGEARMVADIATERGMTSVTVVTTADQVVRARLRFSRCWPGELVMVQAPTSTWRVLRQVPYQSAAMVKALVLEPGC